MSRKRTSLAASNQSKNDEKFIKMPRSVGDAKVLHPIVREATDIPGIKEDLHALGFVVIGNILSSEQKEAFRCSFWNALSRRVPALKMEDVSTWIPENYQWKGNYGAGQYKHYGMAQEEHCWLIRQNEVIRQIFRDCVFEGDDELCVSLDGAAALFEPTESQLQLHVDLVPGIEGFDYGSVQGSYNLYEVACVDGRIGACFVCVPGSHLQYDSIWAHRRRDPAFVMPTKHWHVLEDDSPLQAESKLIITPANCLILWDSKLLHKNYGGDLSVDELGGRACRMTQFVAWQRKSCRSQKALAKKIECVLKGNSGNHWAATGVKVPIIPFPPWGSHTVKTIVPFASCKKAADLPQAILQIL
jgi:hypothetical protein